MFPVKDFYETSQAAVEPRKLWIQLHTWMRIAIERGVLKYLVTVYIY